MEGQQRALGCTVDGCTHVITLVRAHLIGGYLQVLRGFSTKTIYKAFLPPVLEPRNQAPVRVHEDRDWEGSWTVRSGGHSVVCGRSVPQSDNYG